MQYKCKVTVIDKKVFADFKGAHCSEAWDFDVIFRADKKFTEIFMDRNHEVSDENIFTAVQFAGIFDARID